MSVITALGYLPDNKLYRYEKPYCLKFEPPSGLCRSNISTEQRQQTIEDARGREKHVNIDKNGFELVSFNTMMLYQDFEDEEKILSVYLKEAAAVLQQVVGASRVQVFEYVIRKQHTNFPIATGEAYEHNQPTTMVHIDISKDWARKLAGRLNHKINIHELPSMNYRFYNLWKPIKGPIQSWPLALCDNSNLDMDAIESGDVVFQDFTIENEYIRYRPEQKWYYVSDQEATEAWVFEQGDAKPHTRHGVPHSSFQHPGGSNDDLLRETIEVRALAFFDDDSRLF